MKMIKQEQLCKYDQSDIYQCPRCYRYFLYQQDQQITSCGFCSYNLKQFNLQKTNAILNQTIQILLKSLNICLDQNIGIIQQIRDKKYIIYKKNSEINIQKIQKDIQNYNNLINDKVVQLHYD